MPCSIYGLEQALFSICEAMAHGFARKGGAFLFLNFALGLGFGTTVAEPALIAVAEETTNVADTGQMIESNVATKPQYYAGLLFIVAFSVGLAIVLGVLRIAYCVF